MNLKLSNVSITKMTSKGQVVIPEEIRTHMHLEPGTKFIVMAIDDSIVLKKITPIPKNDLKPLLKASRKLAKEYNLQQSDINDTIKVIKAEKKGKVVRKKDKK